MPDIADVVEASQSEIFSVIPRRSSRTRPPRRERPRPAEDAIILYRIGRVAKRVQNELEPLLDAFHANEDIQEQCRLVTQNAGEFLRLQETEDGESSYVAVKCIPAGTRLAAYSGLLREAQPGPSTRRRHDMSIGDPGIGYQIVVDGSPGLSSADDARPGRLQMVDHACQPHNNCVCTRVLCGDSQLPAFFLDAARQVEPGEVITFPYQQVHVEQGRQVYYATDFWQNVRDLPLPRRDQKLVECRCARHLRQDCPNSYGRIELKSRLRLPPPPSPHHIHSAPAPPLPPPPPLPPQHHSPPPPSPPPSPSPPPPTTIHLIVPPPHIHPPDLHPPPVHAPRFSLQPPPSASPSLPTLISLNVGPVGLVESFTSLLPIFDTLPIAVLFQETHLAPAALSALRRTVHKHLPLYCVFAHRPKGPPGLIQVVTLVHVQMAARASLLETTQDLEEVRRDAPECHLQAHFLRMTDPRSGISFLIANVRQYQASHPLQQAAMLAFVERVVRRWGSQSDYTLVGGDFNASLRPRVGYSGLHCIRVADLHLQRWCSESGFICAAPEQHTWTSFNESRQAVLDCFFWKAKTATAVEHVYGATAFDSTDPRLDHRGVRVYLQVEGLGPMPPMEALFRPRRLRMTKWQEKRQEWRRRVASALALEGEGGGRGLFDRLEHVKQVALAQARLLLGMTGGRIRSLIPHHSGQFKKLTARLSLLKVVRREIAARNDREQMMPLPPTKAMRRVWDAGLYPKPAEFATLSELWTVENRGWSLEWLRFLRQVSYSITEELQLLRHSELTVAAEKSRQDAISRFYTGGELRRLLHPTGPSQHTPMLRTAMPDGMTVRGGEEEEQVLRVALSGFDRLEVTTETTNSVRIAGIHPSDLSKVLLAVQEHKLTILSLTGDQRLVFSVSDRLTAWEHSLASEALARKSRCARCQQLTLTPVTSIEGERRIMGNWCNQCSAFTDPCVSAGDYEELFFDTDDIPRVPPLSGATLRGSVTQEDFIYFLKTLPRHSAPGPDQIPYELLNDAPDCMKQVVLACINSILTAESAPPKDWLGGLIRFLYKKGDPLDPENYRPVCLQDTIYKLLTGILTDRLYRLCELHGLLDAAQEGFRRLRCTQRQVQSLHWAIQETAEREHQVFVVYIDFKNAFNSVDHHALWTWLRHVNIPDVDLLQSLYEGAFYVADLPYGRSASIGLTRGTKQGDKLSPLLFGLVFNALLLALKKTGVGHRTVQGLKPSSKGFADDLALCTGTAADMNKLLQVVSAFCSWTGMQVNLPKSVITAWSYLAKQDLATDSILFNNQAFVHLSAEDSFRYLGVRASLVKRGKRKVKGSALCLVDEKQHIFTSTTELATLSKNHKFLFRQMVPAMLMVAASRFRYSAPLVPWKDEELDKLHKVWLQVNKASWRLPPGFPSAPFLFPSDQGGCPVAHPRVHLVQALSKHIEQLVALPDELRATTIRQYQRLCASCGCHTARELAECLREEQSPRPCPIARLLRACAQLEIQIRLPACLSLGKVERETSWHALLRHMQQQISGREEEQERNDLALVTQCWTAIRRRLRRRGIRFPRQLVLDPQQTPAMWLVPHQLKPSPRWLEPLLRLLKNVNTVGLFPRLDRGLGAPVPPVHQQLLHDVISGLKNPEIPVVGLFEDGRWNEVRSSAPVLCWRTTLNRMGIVCYMQVEEPAGVDPVCDLVALGASGETNRDMMLDLTLYLAPSVRSVGRVDAQGDNGGQFTWQPIHLSRDRVEFTNSEPEESVITCGEYTIRSKDNLSRIARGDESVVVITQSRLRLLISAFEASGVDAQEIYATIPNWIKEVEFAEASRGIASHQFWHGLQGALQADHIVGCCPLVAPSSFPSASPDGVYLCWGQGGLPVRPVYNFLSMDRSLQRGLAAELTSLRTWFAVTRRSTLDTGAAAALRRAGQVVARYRKGAVVAACKGSWRTARLRAVQSREVWSVWASNTAVASPQAAAAMREALQRLRLTTDGVVPLDETSPSFREASFGPAAAAYSHTGIVVATDGSLRKNGAMGAAFVAKGNKLQARSVAVFGQPASIRSELAGIALPLEDCPLEEELNILTDSQGSIDLLQSLQRTDFPLWLRGHPVRHLLTYVVRLINSRVIAGGTTRFIKVKSHRAEPLNEAADALAVAAAELDPTCPVELDAEAVYFYYKGHPIQWDARLREDLVGRAAVQCLKKTVQPKRRRNGQLEPPALPLTASWMLRSGHGRQLLGRALEDMEVSSTKRMVIRSIAGAYPCNAVLAKWKLVRSAACALCGHAAETQSHIQCTCPALKGARIRAHHNLASTLWTGIATYGKDWVIGRELTVVGLQGLNPPSNRMDEWYRAMEEVEEEQLEVEVGEDEVQSSASMLRKRPDAWAVSWEARKLFIMEFTRPNDRAADFSLSTDIAKSERYLPLKVRLSHLMPGWEVDVIPFTLGVRGSIDELSWKAKLRRLGMPDAAADRLMLSIVKQVLTEMTSIYSVRQAALLHRQV